MSHSRTPFWVTEDQIHELNNALIREIQAGEAQAQAVHEELSIAKTRYATSRVTSPRLAKALGHKTGSVPVRLSDSERDYLLTLHLSPALKMELK
jgi:hypothetical protein